MPSQRGDHAHVRIAASGLRRLWPPGSSALLAQVAPGASSELAYGDTLHVLCFGSNIKVQASARHHMCAGRIGYSNVAMLKTYHDALQIGCRLSVTRQETRVALSLAFGNVSTVPAGFPGTRVTYRIQAP